VAVVVRQDAVAKRPEGGSGSKAGCGGQEVKGWECANERAGMKRGRARETGQIVEIGETGETGETRDMGKQEKREKQDEKRRKWWKSQKREKWDEER
jgi:hypothetical protein